MLPVFSYEPVTTKLENRAIKKSYFLTLVVTLAINFLVPSNLQAKEVILQNPRLKESLALKKYLSQGYAHVNDTDWISFGPAIIESCKSLVLVDGHGTTLACNENDQKFSKVKAWIINNIGPAKLNCSPNKTVEHGCTTASRRLILYSSSTAARSLKSPGMSNAAIERLLSDTLIAIPISKNVLGCSQAQADAEFNKLKFLIENGRIP